MPFVSRNPQLVLDAETQAHLQATSVSRAAPAVAVERARMLLTYTNGASVAAISGVSFTTGSQARRVLEAVARGGGNGESTRDL